MLMLMLKYSLKKAKYVLTYINQSKNHMYLNIILKEKKNSDNDISIEEELFKTMTVTAKL